MNTNGRPNVYQRCEPNFSRTEISVCRLDFVLESSELDMPTSCCKDSHNTQDRYRQAYHIVRINTVPVIPHLTSDPLP